MPTTLVDADIGVRCAVVIKNNWSREDPMRWQAKLLGGVFLSVIIATTSSPVRAQGNGKYFAPKDQVIAIRAASMFDSKAGALVANPVVLIKGDRITDVGPNVQIPEGAQVINLGSATMMAGMIDTHVHVNTGGNTASLAARALRALANAQIDLDGRLLGEKQKDTP